MNSILIIVFAPLLAAIIAGLGGRLMGHTAAKVLTTGALFLACGLSWPIFLSFVGGDAEASVLPVLTWVQSGAMTFDWALRVDTLTAVMLVVITTVSALVHLYSWGYMDEDPDQSRFFAYLSLFTFAMLMLVTANNLVQMFFGWEGVGLASYLLIGFWYKKPSANAAAIKAFVVNRVGDLGFMLGIFGTFLVFQTTSIPEILAAAPAMQGSTITFLGARWDTMTILCLLLFVGAMGKSAQLGLHTWLPDAMEGPTPVSALIHAATMVTAGVFMVCRLSPDVRSCAGCAGGRHRDRRCDLLLRRHDRHHAVGHQARDRLFHLFAAGLHVLCRRRWRLWRGDVPPVHARLLQGAAVPWRRQRDPRDAPRAGHAVLRRPAEADPLHLLGDDVRHPGDYRGRRLRPWRIGFAGLLVEGRHPRSGLCHRQANSRRSPSGWALSPRCSPASTAGA